MKNFDLEKRLIDFSALIINIVNDEIPDSETGKQRVNLNFCYQP